MSVSEAFRNVTSGLADVRNARANSRNVSSLIASRSAQAKLQEEAAQREAESMARFKPFLDGLAAEMNRAVAQGNFARANEIANQLRGVKSESDAAQDAVAKAVVDRVAGDLPPELADKLTEPDRRVLSSLVVNQLVQGSSIEEAVTFGRGTIEQAAAAEFGATPGSLGPMPAGDLGVPPDELSFLFTDPNQAAVQGPFPESLFGQAFPGELLSGRTEVPLSERFGRKAPPINIGEEIGGFLGSVRNTLFPRSTTGTPDITPSGRLIRRNP